MGIGKIDPLVANYNGINEVSVTGADTSLLWASSETMRFKLLILFLFSLGSTFAQQPYVDSVSYSFLVQNTSEDAWIFEKSNYPEGIDTTLIEGIRNQFENFDLQYFKDQLQFGIDLHWDKNKIGNRKLKSKRLPIIRRFPRKKDVIYLSRPIFLNKDNKEFLIQLFNSSSVGFWSDWSIYTINKDRFEFIESVGYAIGH